MAQTLRDIGFALVGGGAPWTVNGIDNDTIEIVSPKFRKSGKPAFGPFSWMTYTSAASTRPSAAKPSLA